MFHRNNRGTIRPQSKKEAMAQEKARRESQNNGMDQTATRPYAAPQEEMPGPDISVNQNSDSALCCREK